MPAKTAGFRGGARLLLAPRILDFAGQPFGSDFREPILDRAALTIKIAEHEMTMDPAVGPAGTFLAVN